MYLIFLSNPLFFTTQLTDPFFLSLSRSKVLRFETWVYHFVVHSWKTKPVHDNDYYDGSNVIWWTRYARGPMSPFIGQIYVDYQ